MASPTLQEWLPAAKEANPGLPESMLTEYWNLNYKADFAPKRTERMGDIKPGA